MAHSDIPAYYDQKTQAIDIAGKIGSRRRHSVPNSTRIGPSGRALFWGFCTRIAARTRQSPHGELTAYDIDKLFVDQGWRCAVSGLRFEAPRGRRQAFGPSIDRIVAGGRYELGNVRLVCNIVNFAMNEWGEEALHRLVAAMAGRIHDEHPKPLKSLSDVLATRN